MGSPRLGGNPTSTENMHRIKTVLVGDISVGKTALGMRFTQNKFDEHHKHTIGASFIAKTAIVSGCVINFQIWDTAGQERYRSLVPMYLRGAHIACIVYDVTNANSYGSVGFWLDALHHHCDMIQTVLVANKCDLEHSVDQSIAEIFAEEQNLTFFATSAKTGYNVDKLFHTMGSMVVNQFQNQTTDTLTRNKTTTLSEPTCIHVEDDRSGFNVDKRKTKHRCCRS